MTDGTIDLWVAIAAIVGALIVARWVGEFVVGHAVDLVTRFRDRHRSN